MRIYVYYTYVYTCNKQYCVVPVYVECTPEIEGLDLILEISKSINHVTP